MKSVLISIRPKWCALIASGTKTVEVRKTRPNIETPFKCYIYCTEGEALAYPHLNKPCFHFMRTNNGSLHGRKMTIAERNASDYTFANGKVIGEFVCDKIDYFSFGESEWAYSVAPAGSVMPMHETKALRIMQEQGRLSMNDINAYFGDEDYAAYFWHVSNLVIYDKPKELREFRKVCKYRNDDGSCRYYEIDCDCKKYDFNSDGSVNLVKCVDYIGRPPQSWCYVEELL